MIMQISDWKLKIKQSTDFLPCEKVIDAAVPGDITADLYRAGVIDDPFFGLNHKRLGWIQQSDFVYFTEFTASLELLNSEEILLEFDAIDTFADIYLNGSLLGSTDNAFLKYTFSVKKLLKSGANELRVEMRSTAKVMDKIDDTGYFGVFNVKRLFIRKTQCHFGWDWAPDMPGYGMCGAVTLKGVPQNRISDVSYVAFNDGALTLRAELNYTVRSQMDSYGKTLKSPDPARLLDELRYTVALEPNVPLEKSAVKIEQCKITGKKNFKNFSIESPKLWYPAGYGEQPLYEYKIELIQNGEVVDVREGKFAFREVKLVQKPTGADTIGYKFEINGEYVFIKGSNWVPVECFNGTIKAEKYEKLIRAAADGNLNMLRVWGGGAYEKDEFYDLCDRYGVMVWQDMMLACADIPEDDQAFVENMKREITYQIKRLRNHPSIVYWCGGNEKTGSYGLQICRGDYFVEVIMRGLIDNLDGTRPYAKQSPCSQTDIGNDSGSGESHAGSYEKSLLTGVDEYRNNVENSLVPFVSECAVMGADTVETYNKIFPQDKLWEMNEYWEDRLMDNPYSAVDMPFTQRQLFYADGLYGKSSSLKEFVAKSMTAHAEILRAEIEFARANKDKCGGIMNWMYSDIWPSATWAIINYYCEPKQAYYQARRSYAKKSVTFVQLGGKVHLAVINDEFCAQSGEITYGLKKLDGSVVWSKTVSVSVNANGVCLQELCGADGGENAYLFACGVLGGERVHSVWSKTMWKGCSFKSDYTYESKQDGDKLAVTLKANGFTKGVILRLPENQKYSYTDNYFDLEAGEQKTVYISGGARLSDLTVTDYAKEIEK